MVMRPAPRPPLLLLVLVLAAPNRATGSSEANGHLCTELEPLDLLAESLATPVAGDLPRGVTVVQEGGVRGARLSPRRAPHEPWPGGTRQHGGGRHLSFPAARIFTHCHRFPEEFSVVVTLAADTRKTSQARQTLLALVHEGTGAVRLALHVSPTKLLFEFSPGDPGGTGRHLVSFAGVRVLDAAWHTLVMSVAGDGATLAVDCGVPVLAEMETTFPSQMSVHRATFYVGNRRRSKGTFTGLLRQLVLLPGADATHMLCPSPDPQTAALRIPPALALIPPGPPRSRTPFETDLRITLGGTPRCDGGFAGRVWFDARKKSLRLCNGTHWASLFRAGERLNYIDDHQNLVANSGTRDIEVFEIKNVGVFAAVASDDANAGSIIFKWSNGTFQTYQVIQTNKAEKWEFFTIAKDSYLAVANLGSDASGQEFSVVYKWNRRQRLFVPYQRIVTHSARDWESFRIGGETYLAVANHAKDQNLLTDSVIYKWNCHERRFDEFQRVPTAGAYDWEFFRVGAFSFLAVANTYDGASTRVESRVYVLQTGSFVFFQAIETCGATDWEAFTIEGRTFLAVANGVNFGPHIMNTSEYAINSTIYELNVAELMFVKFQDILTYSATDWEFFTVGDEKYLIVANSFDGSSYSLNSVIYRWQGYERFVPVHRLPTVACADWEKAVIGDQRYLLYSNAHDKVSKVLRLNVS
ncbi:thrombospondin-type laminin G domain and EAR repeat-containing protein [Lampetra planeri]